jgi:hypothetical protein
MERLRISPKNFVNRSGFNLNYDNESPLRRIDVGGPDQHMRCYQVLLWGIKQHLTCSRVRMAEFVSKSIDNLSHGLTVKSAMEKLKLREYVFRMWFIHIPVLTMGMQYERFVTRTGSTFDGPSSHRSTVVSIQKTVGF